MTESQEQSSVTSSILKERRFKLSRACDRCRRRRIKCDEGHPCQACLTANSACTFEEPGKRSHPHKSKRTATLEDRMHHLETLIQAIPPAVFAAGGVLPSNTAGGQSPMDLTSSQSLPFMYSPTQFPSGVPPPSLHVFPLMNPSTHFTENPSKSERCSPGEGLLDRGSTPDNLVEETSRVSLAASYLYFDDEGYTRWQGETSGLPVLDLLLERYAPSNNPDKSSADRSVTRNHASRLVNAANTEWFPNRTPRRTDVNPQALWRLMTSYIVPDLMDSLVQCYLSTTYYIFPFLHVPTFLSDYGNPEKWGEPGFAAFVVSVCCLASRHIDDPRVRATPSDGISAGTQFFELFGRLRTLPIADRPTLYNIQANLIGAIYAIGLGKLSKGAALLAEAVTMCIDAGLHRRADTYDVFDAIEDEVRKRTFWSVYTWDKLIGAHFGRPSLLRLRDCDVPEPAPVDDEFITREAVGVPPPGTECRMGAFVCALRYMIVLESVLDLPPTLNGGDASPFMLRATSVLGSRRFKGMHEEEALLDDIHRSIPAFWTHSPETLASGDTIRLTQAERLHCADQFVRLLIYRHRFSELMAERTSANNEEEPGEQEKEAFFAAQNAALQIISTHLQIAKKGLMTYYGVHVIHQLTQAGRTLVAILLNCKTEALQHLIPPGLEALRSCVALLRRFSGRYVCGIRSGDLMEEFCRLTQIPLETAQQDSPPSSHRPPWIRPVRKKAPSAPRSTHGGDFPSQHSSPESLTTSDFYSETPPQNGGVFPSGSPMPSNAPANHVTPPQFSGSDQGQSPYLDSGAGMGMDMIREDPEMYMPAPDMLALFDEGGVDVAHLFSSQYLQSQHHGGGLNDGFNPGFMKHNGLVSSP